MVESLVSEQPPHSIIANNEDPWSEPKLVEAMEIWELTAADQKKLRVLKATLADVKHPWNDPHVVLGFALSGGFRSTERRFRRMITWRLNNNVDRLLTEYKPNPLLLDNSPIAFLKDYDHDGDPIYLERGGAVDVKGLLKRFSKEELMTHSIWLREVQSDGAWFDEYKRRQGREVCNITVVYDLKGLCPKHLSPNVLGFFQNLMKITEDNYPGPIKRMIVIRSPHIFRFAWKTIKHFFSEESRSKMIFAGKDYLGVLSKHMDINVLPSCINPNGHGETAVGMPKLMDVGKIPDHVGKGGVGYTSGIDGGISISNDNSLSTLDTASLSSTDEEEPSSSDSSREEEEEDLKDIMTAGGLIRGVVLDNQIPSH